LRRGHPPRRRDQNDGDRCNASRRPHLHTKPLHPVIHRAFFLSSTYPILGCPESFPRPIQEPCAIPECIDPKAFLSHLGCKAWTCGWVASELHLSRMPPGVQTRQGDRKTSRRVKPSAEHSRGGVHAGRIGTVRGKIRVQARDSQGLV